MMSLVTSLKSGIVGTTKLPLQASRGKRPTTGRILLSMADQDRCEEDDADALKLTVLES